MPFEALSRLKPGWASQNSGHSSTKQISSRDSFATTTTNCFPFRRLLCSNFSPLLHWDVGRGLTLDLCDGRRQLSVVFSTTRVCVLRRQDCAYTGQLLFVLCFPRWSTLYLVA